MSYKDKYSITKIKDTKHNNLTISIDNMGDGKIPVLLFTPSMNDTQNHYHIELTLKEAKILRDWVNKYVNDVEL